MRIKKSMITLGLTLALAGFAGLATGPIVAAEQAAEAKVALTKVEAKKVCMVNNTVFAKDQIPVQFEDRTYYGCCEMCKERLAKDATARTAIDPLTGKKVDKAKALIAALPDGSVLYFENEASFDRYAAEQKN